MAEFYAEIKQNGLDLQIQLDNLPSEFSANIPIKIIKDEQKYGDYLLVPFIVHSNFKELDVISSKNGIPLSYDSETQIVLLPQEAFQKAGYLFLSISLTNITSKETVFTNYVVFKINRSLSGANKSITQLSWEASVVGFVEQFMNEHYIATIDNLIRKSNSLLSENNTIQKTVTQQQTTINDLIANDKTIQAKLEQLITTNNQLQNNVNTTVQKATQQQTQIDTAIAQMGDYEIVSQDPSQIRFKKGNGLYGATVDLGGNLSSKSMVNNGGQIYYGNEFHGETSDYGIEIESIKGNFYQEKTNGYQLFDQSKLPTKTQGGSTVTNNGDGSFTVTGSGQLTEANVVSYIYRKSDIQLKAGKLTIKTENISLPYVYFNLHYENGDIYKSILMNEVNEKSIDVEDSFINSGNYQVRFGITSATGQTIKSATIKPMVYQSGDGTWERFTGGEPAPNSNYPCEPKFFEPSEIYSVGKNLFDGILEVGNISNGNNTNDTGLVRSKNYIAVKPNYEYCFSIDVILNKLVISCYDENKKYLNDTPEGIICENGVFKTLDKTRYIRFRCFREDKTKFESSEDKMQLEEGNVASYFIPNKGQSTTPLDITLRSLPNGVCDTYEDGVVTRRVGKIVFDGSDDEAWTNPTVLGNIMRFQLSKPNSTLTGYCLCDKFKNIIDYTMEIEHIYVIGSIVLFINS